MGDKEAHWPKPGDEGFWRQRGGEVEWVPTEPQALLESDVSPATAPELDRSTGVAAQDAAQAKEYDAWSASIGGEESETWLGFEAWREQHLAAEKEQEKQKNAVGRKAKVDKAKEKKGATALPAHERTVEPPSVTSDNTTTEGSVVEDPAAPSPGSSDSATSQSEALETTAPDVQPDEGLSEPMSEMGADDASEPAMVKADGSQSTGAIPAVGNPSSQLTTLKHRWNFASLDCAAVVHRSNPSAKFASSILSEKKDRYMLSPCPETDSDGQFVVVELCDEISVDTIVLANYEFFSRMFKKFRVRVSRNLNGGDGDWYDIGTFRARNVRGLQVFNTVTPTTDSRFFRYVRIDFLEHYGSEYYCPISLLRVYGLTQMDDYVREEEEMRKQRETELRIAAAEIGDEEEGEGEEEQTHGVKDGQEEQPSSLPNAVDADIMSTVSPTETERLAEESPTASSNPPSMEQATSTIKEPVEASSSASQPSLVASEPAEHSAGQSNGSFEPDLEAPELVGLSKAVIDVAKAAMPNSSSSEPAKVVASPSVAANTSTVLVAVPEGSTMTSSDMVALDQAPGATGEATSSSTPGSDTRDRTANATSILPAAAHESGRTAGGAQQQQQHHGGSESIYRTITKRLNTLETNATLSQQYLEHSRQQLREVFGRMERNQKEKIGEMLRELNSSNWRQIESLKRRQQVDLQQAIFEFDQHRQQTDEERRALLAQVHILSNEVMLEKRFGIAQLVLLLGLFVFMALTRGSRAAPLFHQGIARISRGASTPILASNNREAASPTATLRASSSHRAGDETRHTPLHSRNESRETPGHKRTLSATPQIGKRVRGGLERPVRLRGSVGRRGHSISLLPSPHLGLPAGPPSGRSPARREKDGHTRHDSVSSMSSSSRPLIRLDTLHIDREEDMATPIDRLAPLISSSHRGRLDREDTPTNDHRTVHGMEGAASQVDVPPLPLSTSGASRTSTADESFGSDWGTERSDDDDSHTSPDFPSIRRPSSPSPSISPHTLPTLGPAPSLVPPPGPPPLVVQRIEDSDAEEDSPKWSPVKNRRSIKRPGSSGSHGGYHNPSRVHTPTNAPTPPRRAFSPFHKNTEIEIN